jgi:hypothetical protein
MSKKRNGWIGVDLDGTLAHYDHVWRGVEHIGAPIPKMVARVQQWIAEGQDVRIFTARVGDRSVEERAAAEMAIKQWCLKHIGWALPITATKDLRMYQLWDDRCVQVQENTGNRVDGLP